MFTESAHFEDKLVVVETPKRKKRRPPPFTLHQVSTFFSVSEIKILRKAVFACPKDGIVFREEFYDIVSRTTVRQDFLRLCVLGFFTKSPITNITYKDPSDKKGIKQKIPYKLNREHAVALLKKLTKINDFGLNLPDRSVILASARLYQRKQPITTKDMIMNTTLSGSLFVLWCDNHKDMVERTYYEKPKSPIHHTFTKKIRIIARVWEDITKMVALHSKMK